MKTQALPLRFLIVFLSFVFLSFSSCKKDNADPKEVLPAATMEGKNTFGAIVNGKVWLPKGRTSLFQPNLDVIYDSGFEGGSISIRAYRVEENSDSHEFMVIFMSQVDGTGSYNLGDPKAGGVLFERQECVYDSYEGEVEGKLEITKLDLENGIVAGTFEFTVANSNCSILRVTEGRFDYKIL